MFQSKPATPAGYTVLYMRATRLFETSVAAAVLLKDTPRETPPAGEIIIDVVIPALDEEGCIEGILH